MRILIFGASAENTPVRCIQSFYEMKIRDGDETFIKPGTRGDIARSEACDEFLERRDEFDALFMCDLDQIFPRDALEKLRDSMENHDLDMVSGHYLKRSTAPMQSIWAIQYEDNWPYMPVLDIPDEGLMELAVTGMGCVLIKKEVIIAVDKKIPDGASPFRIGPLPELSGDYRNFGADYYFFHHARQLGFKLWGDASVECPHVATILLTKKLYRQLRMHEKNMEYLARAVIPKNKKRQGMNKTAQHARLEIINNSLAEIAKQIAATEAELELLKDKHKVQGGQKLEIEFWINDGDVLEKLPDLKQYSSDDRGGIAQIESADDLPTFGSDEEISAGLERQDQAINGESKELALKMRTSMMKKHNYDAAQNMNGHNPKNIPNGDKDVELDWVWDGDVAGA